MSISVSYVESGRLLTPMSARVVFCGLLVAAAIGGVVATDRQETVRAVALAGSDWAMLLRAMAGLKALMALGTAAAVVWRLGAAPRAGWLVAYSLAGAVMMAGPGLIWGLAHVGLGALLLHGGLAASLVLLWRDPQVGTRLAAIVASRRQRGSGNRPTGG